MRIELNIDWKKTALITIDVIIALYILMVFISWHKPMEKDRKCTKVIIQIEDADDNVFLNAAEVKKLLEREGLYPVSRNVSEIDVRSIETQLEKMPFVKTSQCYLTQCGHAYVSITQRKPILHVKAESGDDYYIDDNGGVMPNSKYSSDLIIATGNFNRIYAVNYLYNMASILMSRELWRYQIEQINVLPDASIELTPRVGDHIINIGSLPMNGDAHKRKELIDKFMDRQLNRIELFYKHGLVYAGWRKYDYLSFEFANQIICRKRNRPKPVEEPPKDESQSESGQISTNPQSTTD